MQFSEAVQSIVDITHRPDKASDIQAAVNKAISVLSSRPFSRDSASVTITVADPTSYINSVDITAAPFTRFRTINWMKPQGWRKYITWRDPKKIFVDGKECLDVWYMEGVNAIFKVSALISTLDIGYLQYHTPLVADADTDWMLDMMWPAVQEYALMEIFDQIGDDQESRKYSAKYLLSWDLYFKLLSTGAEPA